MSFQRINVIIGWAVFAIATFVYGSTIEPTASFWDCGEFIATADKLEVGHPPGAPFFVMVARIFAFAGEVTMGPGSEAMMINLMSGLCSSFSILFLFWSITHLARKLVVSEGETADRGQLIGIMGAGIVGALAYTFSDSFWFSAVEGEVYAMSSLFTAMVFWAILKWESVADEPHANRWLILIAYLMGLSIGVHLLNLLAIPAITFVYYFKKFKQVDFKGIAITGGISLAILVFVQYVLIPQTVNLASKFELVFVNNLGLPLNSGAWVYMALLAGLLVWSVWYTRKKGMAIANTAMLGVLVILIGYSSFGMILVRSNANPPMDENNPENAFTFLSYLNREQYGDRPLFKGQYWNSPLDPYNPYVEGKPTYWQDKENGEYVNTGTTSVPNYNEDFTSLFPRMYSSQSGHPEQYINWSDFKGKRTQAINPATGKMEAINMPTAAENWRFFWNYQMGWMYGRYFAWNFIGRQNDIQGHGDVMNGNWLTGINFLDEGRLGSQDDLPDHLKDNPARNVYYALPFLLGLIGFFFQLVRHRKDWFIVLLLFFMTGIAIVIYLNQYPLQPRERDYAYAASFYAFAIWIGLGALALYDLLSKGVGRTAAGAISTGVCTLAVPVIMAEQNWDDHDRSDTYTARDFAFNYLESCDDNAILFTNGDNDTFPLWYAQEVEEFRTDVRVCNLSLLNTDWYINQMRRAAYESAPVPFSLKPELYRQGTRDYVLLPQKTQDRKKRFMDLKGQLDFISNPKNGRVGRGQERKTYQFQTRDFTCPVDSAAVVKNEVIDPEYYPEMVDEIRWTIGKSLVMKNDLMIMDLVANNNWERPIYFAITTGNAAYIGLQGHFQLEGLTYRLVPYKTKKDASGQPGRVQTRIMYDNLMNKFHWGGMDAQKTVTVQLQAGDTPESVGERLDIAANDIFFLNPQVDWENVSAQSVELAVPKWIYLNDNNLRMCMNLRNNFVRLANGLIAKGELEKAGEVLDRGCAVMPETNVPYNYFMLGLAEGYYAAGQPEKANRIVRRLMDIYESEINYYVSQKRNIYESMEMHAQQAHGIAYQLHNLVVSRYPQGPLGADNRPESGISKEIDERFKAMSAAIQAKSGMGAGMR